MSVACKRQAPVIITRCPDPSLQDDQPWGGEETCERCSLDLALSSNQLSQAMAKSNALAAHICDNDHADNDIYLHIQQSATVLPVPAAHRIDRATSLKGSNHAGKSSFRCQGLQVPAAPDSTSQPWHRPALGQYVLYEPQDGVCIVGSSHTASAVTSHKNNGCSSQILVGQQLLDHGSHDALAPKLEATWAVVSGLAALSCWAKMQDLLVWCMLWARGLKVNRGSQELRAAFHRGEFARRFCCWGLRPHLLLHRLDASHWCSTRQKPGSSRGSGDFLTHPDW